MRSRITSKVNQISENSKIMLLDLFEKLTDVELKIQSYRQEFDKEYEFSPYEQFLKLKCPEKDFADKNTMQFFLQRYDFITSSLEIELIFDRFDKDKDGKFYFSEV